MSTDFAATIEAWVEATKEQMDRVVLMATLELRTRILVRTPVDTGRLRNNWQLGVDIQPDGVLGYTVKGRRSRGQAVRGAHTADAAATFSGQMDSWTTSGAGHVYYIVNNLPYARRQEYGFCDTDSLGRKYWQWGRNMVGQSIAEWPAIVADAVRATRGSE